MAEAAPKPQQPRLFAFAMGERDAETHVVSACNRAAADLVLSWRRWPGGAAVLTGPGCSGRTHLARVWAAAAQAQAWNGADAAHEAFAQAGGRVLVDDADQIGDEEALVRLFDLARAQGGAVLFVAREEDAPWRPKLADLASRVAAAPRARLQEPDQALLEVVLRRCCRERFLELSDAAAAFLLARMERSFAGARRLADALDQAPGLKTAKPISLASARRVFSDMETSFEDDAPHLGDKDHTA